MDYCTELYLLLRLKASGNFALKEWLWSGSTQKDSFIINVDVDLNAVVVVVVVVVFVVFFLFLQ